MGGGIYCSTTNVYSDPRVFDMHIAIEDLPALPLEAVLSVPETHSLSDRPRWRSRPDHPRTAARPAADSGWAAVPPAECPAICNKDRTRRPRQGLTNHRLTVSS